MSSPPWRSRAQVAGEHTEREDVAAERGRNQLAHKVAAEHAGPEDVAAERSGGGDP